MIHLKKAKNGEFYWISVSKRANTFGETARSSETYKRRTGALKGVASHFKSLGVDVSETFIKAVDHTRKKVKAILYDSVDGKLHPLDLDKEALAEANWVVNQKN